MEKCRICGVNRDQSDLPVHLQDKASKTLTFKTYFEKFACLKYSDDENLPQKICSMCVAEVRLVIVKASFWNRSEAKIKEIGEKRKIEVSSVPSDKNVAKKIKRATISEEITGRLIQLELPKKLIPVDLPITPSKSCFEEIRELFQIDEKSAPTFSENFSRLNVDPSGLEEDGSISDKWLLDNIANNTVWNDIKFQCACEKEVLSLWEYLKHLETHKTSKFSCQETNCSQTYSTLAAFINHTVQHNYEYLAYTCIKCCKIFYNITTLIKHYESQHENIKGLYICVQCGSYCQSLNYLKSHKASHNQENCSDSEKAIVKEKVSKKLRKISDEDLDWSEKPKPRARSLSTFDRPNAVKSVMNLNNSDRKYHPKTKPFDENSNRETFPCQVEGCNSILLSKTGFDYHSLVHSGIKPFTCCYCPKKFRAKALKIQHEKNKHE